MSTDRELLEWAAKAAGYDDAVYQSGAALEIRHGYKEAIWSEKLFDELDTGYWNPLTDDGDALRLAVKLKLDIEFCGRNHVGAQARHLIPDIQGDFVELDDEYDDEAATRRAIVLAAAEIGRAAP